ncbi:MAG: imidazole glycerol phosphate synthase subunit HisH [Bacteroidia bacterium]
MIAIVKYNAGNIRSVQNALNRLGQKCIITSDPDEILAAERVIFPGVGEASTAMSFLRGKNLDNVIKSVKQPFLGICLGLQLMCKYSEEGHTECLGIFDSKVEHFPTGDKVPHMGWNNFESLNGPLFRDVSKEDDVYYVHRYYASISNETIAKCNYILPFSTAFQKDNFFATQFHPEKSASVGEQILKNFLAL